MKISVIKSRGVYIAGCNTVQFGEGDTARAACENAARRMTFTAMRFELLSDLDNPALAGTQDRINAMTDEQVNDYFIQAMINGGAK